MLPSDESRTPHNFQTSPGFQAPPHAPPGSVLPNGLNDTASREATPQGRRFRVPRPYHRGRNIQSSQGSSQGTPDQSLVAENARLKEQLAMQAAT